MIQKHRPFPYYLQIELQLRSNIHDVLLYQEQSPQVLMPFKKAQWYKVL